MRTVLPAALALSALFLLACASPPEADRAIDWAEADDHWSIHIVTVDPDGGERVTQIWLALEGGQRVLRTGDSRWWANLERTSECVLRMGGLDYSMRSQTVDLAEERERIDRAFVEKYGWIERRMFPQEAGSTHENYARLIPR